MISELDRYRPIPKLRYRDRIGKILVTSSKKMEKSERKPSYIIQSEQKGQEEAANHCGDPFKEDNIVVLNGTKEEVDKLRQKMEERRSKAKTKKSKKSKAAETMSTPAVSKEDPEFSSVDVAENGALQNGSESNHSDVAGPSGASGSSKGTKSSTASSTKRSIQNMEEKSEAFKSLFTTHSSAKRSKDQTSNWVTHTPYHF
ncbi:replication termination factor 2-like [Nematolebias whitei]|uniref:replication termination factor 2-like n=1 Tax=Nematolebias whitei TaxID=451745 RepID=UPI0018996828|nr:replication termination factor 2-like [Nematolebias whitei]